MHSELRAEVANASPAVEFGRQRVGLRENLLLSSLYRENG